LHQHYFSDTARGTNHSVNTDVFVFFARSERILAKVTSVFLEERLTSPRPQDRTLGGLHRPVGRRGAELLLYCPLVGRLPVGRGEETYSSSPMPQDEGRAAARADEPGLRQIARSISIATPHYTRPASSWLRSSSSLSLSPSTYSLPLVMWVWQGVGVGVGVWARGLGASV